MEGWYRKTPPGFVFALKTPRAITHDARLRLTEAEPVLADFLRVARLLGDKLGPVLVQLPPSFDRSAANRLALADFLDRLAPERLEVAVELRHASWVDAAVEEAFAERGVAWCLTDSGPTARTLLVPASFVYVRWNRSGLAFPDFSEIRVDRSADLDWWAAVLGSLPDHVQRVYGYFSNEFAGHAPASLRMLAARLGLDAPDPRSAWPQPPLLDV